LTVEILEELGEHLKRDTKREEGLEAKRGKKNAY